MTITIPCTVEDRTEKAGCREAVPGTAVSIRPSFLERYGQREPLNWRKSLYSSFHCSKMKEVDNVEASRNNVVDRDGVKKNSGEKTSATILISSPEQGNSSKNTILANRLTSGDILTHSHHRKLLAMHNSNQTQESSAESTVAGDHGSYKLPSQAWTGDSKLMSSRKGNVPLRGSSNNSNIFNQIYAQSRINQLESELKLKDMRLERLERMCRITGRQSNDMKDHSRLGYERNLPSNSAIKGDINLKSSSQKILFRLEDKEEDSRNSESNWKKTTSNKELTHQSPLKSCPFGNPAGGGVETEQMEMIQIETNKISHDIEQENSKSFHGDIGAQMIALKQHVQEMANEVQQHRIRADTAEQKICMFEANLEASAATIDEKNEKLSVLEKLVPSLKNDIERLQLELTTASERATLAENALQYEREKKYKSKWSKKTTEENPSIGKPENDKKKESLSTTAEEALTNQVRVLVGQLQMARAETNAAKQRADNTNEIESSAYKSLNDINTKLTDTNKELESALVQALHDIDMKSEELLEAKNMISRRNADIKELRQKLSEYKQLKEHAHDDEIEPNKDRVKISEILDEFSPKFTPVVGRNNGIKVSGLHENSEDIVASLRSQLHEREIRLVSVEEELAASLRKQSELHNQALNQAAEIEELQNLLDRNAHVEKDLEVARGQIRELTEALETVMQEDAEGEEVAKLKKRFEEVILENRNLQNEMELKEMSIMSMEGQISMLQQALDDQRAVSSPQNYTRDHPRPNDSSTPSTVASRPGLELEKWLMEP